MLIIKKFPYILAKERNASLIAQWLMGEITSWEYVAIFVISDMLN
jgi:hypothetical protein